METPSNVGGRLLPWFRLLFLAATVGGVVLGLRGLREFLPGRAFWDLAYYDLQLFVLGSTPLEQPGPYPVPLGVARFLLPATTAYAIFEATRALFARQIRRWWQRSVRRGHVIVTGEGSTAMALLERLLAGPDGRRVVAVPRGELEDLRASGVGGARALYACADDAGDSTVNVSTALAAVNVAPRWLRRRPLRVYAQVSEPTLALALRARWLGRSTAGGQDVDFFNVDELAGAAVLDLDSVTVPPGEAPHIVVAGGGTFGRAAVVAYAHFWRLYSPRRYEQVTVTLVDPHADAVVADLMARWDVVTEALDLRAVNGDLAKAFRDQPELRPHRAYICYDDEDLALREALTVASLWRGGPDSVVVRLSRLHRHGEAFHGRSGLPLLDDLGGRLRLVGVTKLASEDGVVERSLVEQLAQAIHEQYLIDQRASPTPGGAYTPWRELSEGFRASNRAQAHDIGGKLAMIGCTVAPRVGPVEKFAFTAGELEELAVREHERWSAERTAAGWRYGSTRNNDKLLHPSLVSWDDLPESEREKDRDAVRLLPAVLAQVGLRIVRLTPTSPPRPRPELSQPLSV